MSTQESLMSIPRKWPAFIAGSMLVLLAGCGAVERRDSQALYDLGPVAPLAAPKVTLAPLAASEVSAPAWMDSTRMVYRLAYENPMEARTYSQSRWAAPPSRLLLQRVKQRLAEAGGAVLGSADGASGVAQLRIEADDFSHVFTSPSESHARVSVRVTVLHERRLVAQRSFMRTAPAPSADAAGGVQALAVASDAVIAEMMGWLSTLPLPR